LSQLIENRPLVSCIIIFYNANKDFLQEAVESIFAQTYDHWELLLVDDGSTDGSSDLALHYTRKFPEQVRYLEHAGHQNKGMSASRNLGIHHANGEYLAFLDADDIWLPQKLEKQIAILQAQPEAAMVYGASMVWYSWTGIPEDSQRDRMYLLGVKPDTLVNPPILFVLILSRKADPPCTCSILIRRQSAIAVGGFEETFRGLYEDQVFFYKIFLKEAVFVESGCWDRYRQHSQGCCYLAKLQGHHDPEKPSSYHFAFLTWLKEYLTEQNITDAEILHILEKEFWPYKHKRLYAILNFFRRIKGSVVWRLNKMVNHML